MTLTNFSTYTNENFQNLSSVLLPIVNLYYGSYAPVDTQSFYGFYGYFFIPIFSFLDFNLTNISLIFAFIFFVCLILMYSFIYYYSKNLLLSFIFLVSSIFLLTSFANVWPGDLYLQYRPIRMLSPCTALLLFIYYDRRPSYIRLFYSFILLSILSVWNIDSGLPTLFAFLVSILIICYFQGHKQLLRKKIYQFFAICIISVSTFIGVWLFFIGYIYIKSGKVVSLLNLIEPFM